MPSPLGLDIIGECRELTTTDIEERTTVERPKLTRLRDSHHTLARLIGAGLSTEQASLQTGYTPQRIYTLKNDPTFQNLVAFYRRSRDEARLELEARYLLIANDAAQLIHEQILDEPEEVSMSQALAVFESFADRAGMGPTAKSISKNINLNIGDRLDAARRRTAPQENASTPQENAEGLRPQEHAEKTPWKR
jgi:hypothetical protein